MICPVLNEAKGGFQMKRTEWLQETRRTTIGSQTLIDVATNRDY